MHFCYKRYKNNSRTVLTKLRGRGENKMHIIKMSALLNYAVFFYIITINSFLSLSACYASTGATRIGITNTDFNTSLDDTPLNDSILSLYESASEDFGFISIEEALEMRKQSIEATKKCEETKIEEVMEKYLEETRKKLEELGKNPQQAEKAAFLKRELDFFVEHDQVSTKWGASFLLRILLAFSHEPSEEEKEVTQHILGKPYTYFFRSEAEWKKRDNFTAILSKITFRLECFRTKSLFNSGHNNYWSGINDVSKNIHEKIQKELAPFPLAVLNKSFFDPISIILAQLNNLYLVAVPGFNEKLDAHGVKNTTPIGYAIHDIFHGYTGISYNHLINHITKSMKKAYDNGNDINTALEEYLNIALDYHNCLLRLFKKILEEHVKKISDDNPQIKKIYGKSLIAFFYGMHEYNSWDERFYEITSPNEIISIFTENLKKTLSLDNTWENPSDPLNTSFKDGKSSFEEEDIINIVKKKLFPSTALELEVTGQSLKQEKRFIKVKLNLRDGQKKKIAFPTLKHKVENSRGILELFKWAGINHIEYPLVSENSRHAKIMYQSLLNEIYETLLGATSQFSATSLGALEENYNNEIALGQHFEQTLKGLKNKEEKIISAPTNRKNSTESTTESLLERFIC